MAKTGIGKKSEAAAPRAAYTAPQQENTTTSKLGGLRLPEIFKKKPKPEERERIEPTLNKTDNNDLAISPGLTD